MQAMCRAGYLASSKGKSGGIDRCGLRRRSRLRRFSDYLTDRRPDGICQHLFFYMSTPIEKERKLLELMRNIRDDIVDELGNTTVADVL
ncbi:MAG: hypothetical protein NC930_01790 [Candidatus Omnitrophica bacterium]|nr:hypothetical protein [Candidatus Omnitrophota bacterium]